MTTLSKNAISEILKDKTCRELIHPWTDSCSRAAFNTFFNILPGNLKFFIPLVFVPAVIDASTKFDLDHFYNVSLVNYSKVCLNSFVSTNLVFWLACLLHRCGARPKEFTLFLIPTMLGAGFIYTLPNPLTRIHAQGFFNIVLEGVIKGSDSQLIKNLRKSKSIGILLFMTFSSIIMYNFKVNRSSIFWFIQPTHAPGPCDNSSAADEKKMIDKKILLNKILPQSNQFCSHSSTCDDYIVKGIIKYAQYGLALEVVKRVFSSIHMIREGPLKFIAQIFDNTDYKFVKFWAVYAGIFRLSNCLINHSLKCDTNVGTALAGFLSGVAYGFSPNYYFLTLAFSTAVQLAWHTYQIKKNKPKILELMNRLPLAVIVYCISAGMLVQYRLFEPKLIPKFGRKITDMLSGGLSDDIHKRIKEIAVSKNLYRL